MLEAATGYREDLVDGRFIIETRHRKANWEVIVEPDEVVLWWSSRPTRSTYSEPFQ